MATCAQMTAIYVGGRFLDIVDIGETILVYKIVTERRGRHIANGMMLQVRTDHDALRLENNYEEI